MRHFFAVICFAVFCGLSAPAFASADIYGKLPSLENVDLSPKGTRYAFITEVKGQQRLIVMDAEDKVVFQSALPPAKIRGMQWASEDQLFVNVSDTQNMQAMFGITLEISNVLWINIKDNKAGFVFKDDPKIAKAVFGTYGTAEVDGTAYGYFAGMPLTRSTSSRAGYILDTSVGLNLYRVNLATGDARPEAPSVENGSSDWVVDAEGKIAATAIYFTKDGAWRLHAGKGMNAPLRETKSSLAEISLAGLGRTPGTVIVSDGTGEGDQLQEVNTATGAQTLILEQYNVEKLIYDPVTRLLLGAHVLEQPGAVFFEPKLTGRWRSLQKGFPDLNLKLISWSSGLDNVVVHSDGAHDSGTFWKVDLKTGATKVLGYAYPAIRAERVASTQMFKYKAQDGTDMEGVLTLPVKGSTNLPVVVMPHGGPIGVSDKLGFDWWAQAYADAGYAVFQPNYRGSGGYGAKFRDAGYGEWGGKMLSDIADGLKALSAAGTVDPKRACIVGASYGGYAALAGVTVQQGLYKCAVSVSGVADVSNFYSWIVNRRGRQTSSTRFYRTAFGAVSQSAKVMTEISPATYAARTDAPVLLIHGEDDTVVPISQSALMAGELKSADKPVEFIRMKGEDHWLSTEATRIEMLTHALAFVKKHNPAN